MGLDHASIVHSDELLHDIILYIMWIVCLVNSIQEVLNTRVRIKP